MRIFGRHAIAGFEQHWRDQVQSLPRAIHHIMSAGSQTTARDRRRYVPMASRKTKFPAAGP